MGSRLVERDWAIPDVNCRITLVINRMRVFANGRDSRTVLCARSINPFEGGRWRLRRMRASGCTPSNGFWDLIFFCFAPFYFFLVWANRGKKKTQVKNLPFRHT